MIPYANGWYKTESSSKSSNPSRANQPASNSTCYSTISVSILSIKRIRTTVIASNTMSIWLIGSIGSGNRCRRVKNKAWGWVNTSISTCGCM